MSLLHVGPTVANATMQMKLFEFRSTDHVEEAINSWMKENENVVMKHITQSQCERQGRFSLLVSIYYQESD